MELTIVPRDDDVALVQLSGSLDIEGTHEIDIRFHGATAAAGKSTIVDISQVDFVASLGIGMFFACAKSLHNKGGRLVLLNPQELVQNVLHKAQLDSIVPIAHSMEEALALIRAESD